MTKMSSKVGKILVALALGLPIALVPTQRLLATISDLDTRTVTALGNGVTTNYTIGFTFQDNDDVKVYLEEQSTTPYTRTLILQGAGPTKFTITGGDPGTTVVMGTAPSATQRLIIKRVSALTQGVDYVETDAFPAEDHEEAMDKMTLSLQEQKAEIDQKIGLSDVSTYSTPTLPDPYADRFVLYNHAGDDLTLAPTESDDPAAGEVLKYSGTAWTLFDLDTALDDLQTDVDSRVLQTDFDAHTGNTTTAHGAVSTATANKIVIRDGSANFAAGTITAALNGNAATATLATTATTAVNVSGTVAIANGGTGETAADAAFDALAPTTTKGDVLAHTVAGSTRLPLGTDGFVLTADSTTATGLKWATGPASTAVVDNSFSIDDNTDPTIQILFDTDGTAGTATTLLSSQTANRTLTLPNATDTLVGKATTDTFTNKSISGATNTLSAIPNTATTADSANTASAIVTRDGSGNFAAGTITASLTGNVTGNLTGNVTGNTSGTAASITGNLTGDVTSVGMATTYAGVVPKLKGGAGADQSSVTYPSTGTIATIAGTQILTNKDIDGGTAADTSRVTLSKADSVTLAGLTRKEGTVFYDTDKDKVVFDNGSTLTAVGTGSGTSSNLASNPGFEDRTTNWSASGGTFTYTSTAADLGSELLSGSWDSSGAAQTLTNTAVVITSGDGTSGQNGAASCRFKAATGTATHLIQAHDGTNVLGSTTITSSTSGYVRTSVNFPFPVSGSVSLRVLSVAANEPTIYIDDCYFGLAAGFNISQQSQAREIGTLRYTKAASCQWSITQGTYAADYAADTDCSAPTVTGSITAPATKIPAAVLASAAPGTYYFHVSFNTYGTAATYSSCRLVDESSNEIEDIGLVNSNQATGNLGYHHQLVGRVEYTTSQSNKTYKLQCKSSSGAVVIYADTAGAAAYDAGVSFKVTYFPSSSQQTFGPDNLAASWSGYHDSSCTWTTAASSFGDPSDDGTCTFTEVSNRNFGTVASYGAKGPGITFTPPKTGRYMVIANVSLYSSSNNAYTIAQLYDGTSELGVGSHRQPTGINTAPSVVPVVGVFNATSTASASIRLRLAADTAVNATIGTGDSKVRAIYWNIFQLDAAQSAPVLVGSITSNSTGTERFERATYSAACSAGTCTISSQSGTWLTTTFSSTGIYNLAFAAGTFSAPPTCTYNANDNRVVYVNADTTSTTAQITVRDTGNVPGGGSAPLANFSKLSVHCMGPR